MAVLHMETPCTHRRRVALGHHGTFVVQTSCLGFNNPIQPDIYSSQFLPQSGLPRPHCLVLLPHVCVPFTNLDCLGVFMALAAATSPVVYLLAGRRCPQKGEPGQCLNFEFCGKLIREARPGGRFFHNGFGPRMKDLDELNK